MTEKIDKKITLCLSIDWVATPKSQLELIIEQSPPPKCFLPNVEDCPVYKHLILLDIEDAENEVINLITKRYTMFCRTLPNESKTKLDQTLKKSLESQQYNKKEFTSKLKTFIDDDKIAAFIHIRNSYSSIKMGNFLYKKLGGKWRVNMLCGGLEQLYSGDQRYFKETIKTRPEVAKEGGLARKDNYLNTKQEACKLLDELRPPEDWTSEIAAYKAILPNLKKYMENNDIKYPALISIEKTLRRWIKNDPIVSAAVRIAKPPTHYISD